MKNLLISLMKRFLQPTAVNGKLTKDLLKIDSSDSTIHLDLNKMDFGEEAKNQVNKISCEKKRFVFLQQMRDGYISVVKHLQKKLPLDLQILKDITCLGAQMRSEPWTVNAIGRIAVRMPHVITEREVSFVKNEWKLYQAANISKDWYIDFDTKILKRVDHYWTKVFESNNEYGKTKYGYLSKVVKSCLTI
nr:uncharacterized protein LOC124815456 [Hydra vulgaris]